MKLRSTALLGAALTLSGALAQEFTIDSGNINTCQGVLMDTGGQAGAYGNNEEHTITICPDGEEPAVTLNWLVFDLSTAGTEPIDQISIHDGLSTADPLIGTWTGSSSPGVISASFANPSGCLTVVFTSNSLVVRQFEFWPGGIAN